MYKLYPYFTNDGSVGLFSPSDNDIYHSTYGAAAEAYEKFIFPSNLTEYKKNKIKILDICFGIGYNSKSFLNFIFQNEKKFPNFFIKNNFVLSIYNDKIHSDKKYEGLYLSPIGNDKISYSNNCRYNDKIYNDKISAGKTKDEFVICNEKIDNDKINGFQNVHNPEIEPDGTEIYVKAIDTDKILAYLSPFIKSSNGKIPKNYKLPFDNEKISRLLMNGKSSDETGKSHLEKQNLKLDLRRLIEYPMSLNLYLYSAIIESNTEILNDADLISIISDKKYAPYFNAQICRLFKLYIFSRCSYTPIRGFGAFLHNIYYNYLSNRHKNDLKRLKNMNINFELKINDARTEIKNDSNIYNYIFLDAFTASKCPCLWTIDFFKLLYERLDNDGMILTYSNSAAVRNAFINAGFYVGKIYNPNSQKFTGTVAVKNHLLIKNKLSEFDLGLLKTKAGIFYRDENLNSLNDEILSSHKKEVDNSTLMSSSSYIKSHKKLS